VFPRPRWESFRDQLMGLTMDAEPWRRIFLGSAVDVDVDSASRLLVPPELRGAAALTRDVLLIGNGRRARAVGQAERHAAHEAKVFAQPMPAEIRGFVLR
jgi:MraZ protein